MDLRWSSFVTSQNVPICSPVTLSIEVSNLTHLATASLKPFQSESLTADLANRKA